MMLAARMEGPASATAAASGEHATLVCFGRGINYSPATATLCYVDFFPFRGAHAAVVDHALRGSAGWQASPRRAEPLRLDAYATVRLIPTRAALPAPPLLASPSPGARVTQSMRCIVMFACCSCIPLWPGVAPNETDVPKTPPETRTPDDGEGCGPGRDAPCDHINDVSMPTLTPFLVTNGTGAAIIIAPGGGYHDLAWGKEGIDVAHMCTKSLLLCSPPPQVPPRPAGRKQNKAKQKTVRMIFLVACPRRQLDWCVCIRAQVPRARPPEHSRPSKALGAAARCSASSRLRARKRQKVRRQRIEDRFHWWLGRRAPYCAHLDHVRE